MQINISKPMGLEGEEGSLCRVTMDERQLEYVKEFKHLRYVLDESGRDGEDCCIKEVN